MIRLYVYLTPIVSRSYSWVINFLELSETDTQWTMKTVILLNMIIAYLTIISAILIGVSLMILKYFPQSKLSGWIRRNIITDVDLEPIKVEESEPSEVSETDTPSGVSGL